MPRRLPILLYPALGILLATGCSDRWSPLPGRSIDHLILISIDTLRADHLRSYGNSRIETPTLDALADQGVVFERHVSAAPTTLASHTSLMTGLWPHHHGVPRNGFRVSEENRTLAEVLRDAGFTTAGFIGAFPLDRRFGIDQGFTEWNQRYDQLSRDGLVDQNQRSADAVNGAVAEWLETDDSRRVFLFVHYFDVHWPYEPPPPWDRRYRSDTLPMDGSLEAIREVRQGLVRDRAATLPRSRALADLYAGEVSWVDSQLAVLFQVLRRHGLWDDALIVVTSDHGEAMDEHWEHWNHGRGVYDETVRAPLLIRLPRGRLAGSRSGRVVSNVDLFPTLLDLLELESPAGTDGVSFAPLLRGKEMPPREPVFAEATKPHGPRFERGVSWANARKPAAVRVGRWKLIHHPLDGRTELYDLDRDPGETTDLVDDPSPEIRRVRRDLARKLRTWRAGAGAAGAREGPDPEARERLEALGYVDD